MKLHVVVIPDGNRRWAKEKGLAPWRGHKAGAERTKEVLQTALDADIYCLSLWGGSWENLTKRSKLEIKALFRIYEIYLRKLKRTKEIHEHKIRVRVIGRWRELLPKSFIKAADALMKETEGYSNKLLNFFIAYNGTDEMLWAIKGIVKEAKQRANLKVTSALLEKHLWTGVLPPVDLVIRTGSADDPHNSTGFMMWRTASSQLYFTNTFYPAFDKKEFLKALEEYQRRERRMGK